MMIDGMFEYRVTFFEEPGEKHPLVFDCHADDLDHAREQTINAYPLAVILKIRRLPN